MSVRFVHGHVVRIEPKKVSGAGDHSDPIRYDTIPYNPDEGSAEGTVYKVQNIKIFGKNGKLIGVIDDYADFQECLASGTKVRVAFENVGGEILGRLSTETEDGCQKYYQAVVRPCGLLALGLKLEL